MKVKKAEEWLPLDNPQEQVSKALEGHVGGCAIRKVGRFIGFMCI